MSQIKQRGVVGRAEEGGKHLHSLFLQVDWSESEALATVRGVKNDVGG